MVCRLLLETGRGAAWLAHLLWEQRVAGSNPVAPTKNEALLACEKGFFCRWAPEMRTCEQAGLTQCFQERSSARKTRRGRSNPVAPTKIEALLACEKGFFCRWAPEMRTCEQAGLTQCFQERSSARKTRRGRSNPVAPTKIKPFSLARRVFLCR